MKTYRCTVDDVVFNTNNIDSPPTTEGHPECPGPECRKRFANWSPRSGAKPVVTAPVQPAPATPTPLEAAPVPAAAVGAIPSGQSW